jgi:Zn-dependent protease
VNARRRIFGLELSATPSALATYAALALVGAGIQRRRRHVSVPAAVALGVMLAGLHAASVLLHHVGHASFARSTGYPMVGVRFWGGLATSVYPPDEPPLATAIHLRRAAGGPLTSLAAAIIVAVVTARVGTRGGIASDLARLVAMDNLLVLALGSFVPLSFTDGGTVLECIRRR